MLAAGLSAEAVSVILGLAGITGGVFTAVLTQRAQGKQTEANHKHALDVLERQKQSGEQQQLRNDLLTAAAALAGRLTAVQYRLTHLSRGDAFTELDDIRKVLNDAGNDLGRVAVLFGDSSATTQRAEAAYSNLRLLHEWTRLLLEAETGVEEKPPDPRFSLDQMELEREFAAKNLRSFKHDAYASAAALTSAQPPDSRTNPPI